MGGTVVVSRDYLLSWVLSLTLAEHLGDVTEDVEALLHKLGMEEKWGSLEELAEILKVKGVKYLHQLETSVTIPVIPPLTPEQKRQRDSVPDPNPTVAICGECKIELKRVMGYVCNNQYCPCQPRIT